MKTETYNCQACGDEVTRPVARGQRPKWCEAHRYRHHKSTCECCGTSILTWRNGRFCGELCEHFTRYGPQSSKWSPPRPVRVQPEPFVPEVRACLWCEVAFVARVSTQVYCRKEHKRKAIVVRRRGRAHGSTSHYTWAEFMRVFLHHDRRCAYCEGLMVGQPDPDHVVPLSRGGSNSITNILPSCRACNSDKRDLLLDEWAADRARRGLEPRITSWSIGDPRIVHLTSISTAA